MGAYKATARADATLEEKLRTQVEFYFSDSNLPRDKFLRSRVEADPGGYVDLQLIVTFKRMREANATVATVAEAVAGSELVELSADKLRVRRKKPLPLEDTSKQRSIYVKGYKPGESPSAEPRIEEVVALFEPFGKVLSVRMRRKKVHRWRESGQAPRTENPGHETDSSSEEMNHPVDGDQLSVSGLGPEIRGDPTSESSAHEASIRLHSDPKPTTSLEHVVGDRDVAAASENFQRAQEGRSGDIQDEEQARTIFKGSVFVEFDSADAVAKVLQRHAEEPFRVPGADRCFIIERKDVYLKRKNAETKEARRARKRQQQQTRSNGDALSPRSASVFSKSKTSDQEATSLSAATAAADAKEKKSAAGKVDGSVDGSADASSTSGDEVEDSAPSDVDASEDAEENTFEPGLILRLEGIGPAVDRDEIRSLLSDFGEIGWIDHSRGGDVAHVRFLERGAAARATYSRACTNTRRTNSAAPGTRRLLRAGLLVADLGSTENDSRDGKTKAQTR
ncbi:hypothetical protein F1559_004513 [Cyanidiococcus yangmingshanensis]|uniref:Uncharacterized protein n=1 Tax=Cyanidiococcus yangmingshanensis TaxID=2690220 RepID=A0A7J7IPV3_9RHOD|nr:hypothetical protein F1559_004513 [Cyanidiococcus yangmingshanensis]